MSVYQLAAQRVEHALDRFRDINKTLLFAVLSAAGAFIGSAVGLIVNPFQAPGFMHLLWWDAVLGCGIGTTLAVVQNWHLGRLSVAQRNLLSAAAISAGGGLAAGCALYMVKRSMGFFLHPLGFTLLPHVAAWTAEGIIIAVAVSRVIPNLRLSAALIAGTGAGFLGGLFTHQSILHVTLADGLKGVFIAFFLGIAERMARSAWLVVKRDRPSAAGRGLTLLAEAPTLSLGQDPIRIGSTPECQVVVPADDGPPVRAEISFANGLVTCQNFSDGKRLTLQHGQSLRFGNVTLEVATKAENEMKDPAG